MTTYVDSSALLKRYVEEPDSDVADQLLAVDPVLVTSWVTVVEVRRNLGRLLQGAQLSAARRQFNEDIDALAVVACDAVVAESAASIAETLGVRSLDAIHLASAQRILVPGITFITFDLRQGQAARSLGMTVLGC